MQVGFLATNHGPHPADKWAEVTADTIVETLLVDANMQDISPEAAQARASKRALRGKLFDIFNGHHDGVQKAEQKGNAKVKTAEAAAKHADHRETPIDPKPHVDRVMDEVNAAFAQTPWAAHLASADVQAVVRTIISQHTADVMHIERRWHHDRLRGA